MFVLTMRICRGCNLPKNEEDLVPLLRDGKKYFRSWCLTCDAEKSAKWRHSHLEQSRDYARKKAEKKRASRLRGDETPKWILCDSRDSDKKKGLENDLTKEFIQAEISNGCFYCGETSLRMTLDRKDNAKGHTKDNVVPACIRCNYTRKDMPFEAWIVLSDGMRQARIKGLFGSWTGRAR